jgi:hypothetical protein
MKLVYADIETDGINPTKIHFIRVKTDDGFAQTFFDMSVFKTWVEFYLPDKWVFHNGLGYDVWHINRLVAPLINPRSVIDTFVVSRLIAYEKHITHSLEELGEYLGYKKLKFNGPWDVCTEEMVKYGEQDVEVLQEVFEHYKRFIYDPDWAKAMRVEHDMAIVSWDMSQNGFTFNKPEAEKLLESVTLEMKELEDSFQKEYPPKLVEVNRLKYRTKKDGSLFSTVEDAMSKYPLTKVDGDDLVCFDYQAFNPGSPVDRIDVLWDAGWKPVLKTKGYKKFEKERR